MPGSRREESVVTFREHGNLARVYVEAKELVTSLQQQGVTHKFHEYYQAVRPTTDHRPQATRPGAPAQALRQPAGKVEPAGPPVTIAPAPPPAAVAAAVTEPPKPAGNDAPEPVHVPTPTPTCSAPRWRCRAAGAALAPPPGLAGNDAAPVEDRVPNPAFGQPREPAPEQEQEQEDSVPAEDSAPAAEPAQEQEPAREPAPAADTPSARVVTSAANKIHHQ